MKEGTKRLLKRSVYFVVVYFITSFAYAVFDNEVNTTDVLLLSFIVAWIKDAEEIKR